MKQRVIFLALCLFMSQCLWAQKKCSSYAIELSLSFHPNLVALLGNQPAHWGVEGLAGTDDGWLGKRVHHQQVNAAFTWNRNKRWEFQVMCGINTVTYHKYNYTEYNPDSGKWSGELVEEPGLKSCYGSVHLTGVCRVKYAYMPHAHLYSAFGLGFDTGIMVGNSTLFYPPLPYLTPIGIKIGEDSLVFGFVEATLGTGATGILAGLGFKIPAGKSH